MKFPKCMNIRNSVHKIHSMLIKTQVQIRKLFECKIVNIFLPINLNMCIGCSKETSHLDGSFEYRQHMFWLRS